MVNIYPALFQKARESISDMSKANYFYITSYPSYSGFRVEHDPVFTAYVASSTTPTATGTPLEQTNQPRIGFILAVIAVIVLVIVAVALVFRKKANMPAQI